MKNWGKGERERALVVIGDRDRDALIRATPTACLKFTLYIFI
jgi:hypothetical protein